MIVRGRGGLAILEPPAMVANVNIRGWILKITLMKLLRHSRPVLFLKSAILTAQKTLRKVTIDISRLSAVLIFAIVICTLSILYRLGIAWRKAVSLVGRKT